jgi:cytidylate kinase
MNISITGDLGSGKSAVTSILMKKGYSHVSVGAIFREIATKRGVSVTTLNEMAFKDPSIDKYVDDRQRELGYKRTKAIFDSRLGWYFVPNSFKVYLTVDLNESARRIMNDKTRVAEHHTSLEETKEAIIKRSRLEATRYMQKYCVDYTSYNNYDLVIDTTDATPEEVANEILRVMKKHINDKRKNTLIALSPYRIYPTQSTRDLSESTLNIYINELKKKKTCCEKTIDIVKNNELYFVIDGHHRLLASQVTKKRFIYCTFVNYNLKLHSDNSKYYDFEDIGKFRYRSYPCV